MSVYKKKKIANRTQTEGKRCIPWESEAIRCLSWMQEEVPDVCRFIFQSMGNSAVWLAQEAVAFGLWWPYHMWFALLFNPNSKFEFLVVNPLMPKAQGTCFPFRHAKIRWFLPAFLILSSTAANLSSALTAALGSVLQISALYSAPLPCWEFPPMLGSFLHAEEAVGSSRGDRSRLLPSIFDTVLM